VGRRNGVRAEVVKNTHLEREVVVGRPERAIKADAVRRSPLKARSGAPPDPSRPDGQILILRPVEVARSVQLSPWLSLKKRIGTLWASASVNLAV